MLSSYIKLPFRILQGSVYVHLITKSYEKANFKLNKSRDLNTQFCWLNYTTTQLCKSVPIC